MIFTDFLKAEEEKNKYGMLAQNFNRKTNVAMEHNNCINEINSKKVNSYVYKMSNLRK